MSLGASVMCRCYQEGRTTVPPVDSSLVIINEDGYLAVDLPWEGHADIHNRLYEWQRSACAHKNMNYASVHLSNWAGYRAFQQALERAGLQHFPTLVQELPQNNGGILSAASAPRALQELDYFVQRADLGTSTYLVDTLTGDELYEYIEGYGGRFVFGGSIGFDFGFDTNGFFIATRSDSPSEVFRAKRFEQRLLEPALIEAYQGGDVEYINSDTGERFVCQIAVSGKRIPWPDGRWQNDEGKVRSSYPQKLHVASRKQTVTDYDYIVQPLVEILHASLATGNPVCWT